MNLNSVNVADTNQQAHNEQITEFVDDVALQTSVKPEPAALQPWYKLGEEDRTHSVIDVLERPTLLYNLTTTAGSANDNLQYFSLPYLLLQTNVNYRNKLAGYSFFRADTVIRVSINAEPMAQGKFWLWFNPHGNVAAVREVTDTLQCKTGFQGIEIDVATGAPVELHIPYCSQFSHYNMSTGSGNQGRVTLTKLTPTVGTVDLAIHGWFTNISLHMPTTLAMVIPPDAQVGREQDSKSAKGLISGPMSVVADAADVLSSIPSLSSVTDRVGWAARLMAGAAEYVGYSRPMNMQNVGPMKIDPMRGHTNLAGLDNSVTLGPNQDMELGYPSQVFGTDADEMDIRFVAGRLGYLDQYDWTTSQGAQTVLFRLPVTPSMFQLQNRVFSAVTTPLAWGPQTIASYRGPHMSYISNLFNYWRGSIKFRFAVAKTAFHSGRLRFTYFPTGPIRSQGFAYQSADHQYTKILDLSVSSEISFEVPYTANRPWKVCYPRDYSTCDTLALDKQEQNFNGHLQIDVMSQLRANAGCSTTVQVLIFVAGGDDLSFMDMGKPYPAWCETSGATAQIFNQVDARNTDPDQTVERREVMFPKSTLPPLVPEKLSMSGAIVNLRALTRRFYPTHFLNGTITNTGAAAFLDYFVRLDPNYMGHWFNPPTTALNDTGCVLSALTMPDQRLAGDPYALATYPPTNFWGYRSVMQNPIEYLSFIYRAWRGSVRYKAHRDGVEPDIGERATSYFERSVAPLVALPTMPELGVETTQTIAGVTYPTSFSLKTFSHSSVSSPQAEANEINVPYTNAAPFCLVSDNVTYAGYIKNSIGSTQHPEHRSIVRFVPQRSLRNAATFNEGYTLYASKGDDFSFGMLVGPPTILAWTDGSEFV